MRVLTMRCGYGICNQEGKNNFKDIFCCDEHFYILSSKKILNIPIGRNPQPYLGEIGRDEIEFDSVSEINLHNKKAYVKH